jgi:drug/metabolite transporter (DMT)-like permease
LPSAARNGYRGRRPTGAVASMSRSARDAFSFLIIASAWGLNYLFVRAGIRFIAPLWLALLRAGIGAMAMAAFVVWARPAARLDRADVGRALLVGVPNTAIFFGLWFLAAPQILPGEAAVLVYTFPLWVALLTFMALTSATRRTVALAVGAGFVGVVLVAQPWEAAGHSVAVVAIAELLAGAVAWAVGTVLSQRWFAPEKLVAVNLWQLVGGSLGLGVAAIVLEPDPHLVTSPMLVGIVLWLGVVGTALAYGLWFALLARTPAAILSTYAFLVPVIALFASALVLGERLVPLQLVGVAFVLGAIYVAGRSRATDRRRAAAVR